MKKIFNFTKKKKGFSPNTSDTGSVLSVGYDLKEKDLGKVHKAAYGGDLAKLKHLAKKNDINQLDKENRYERWDYYQLVAGIATVTFWGLYLDSPCVMYCMCDKCWSMTSPVSTNLW